MCVCVYGIIFSESEDGQKELEVYQELGEDIIKQRKVRLLFFGVIKQVKIISMFNINCCIITNNIFLQYLDLWLISETDKEVLKKSWDIIVKDMERIGVVMFLKMFETHPETLSSFIHEVYSIRELEMDEW